METKNAGIIILILNEETKVILFDILLDFEKRYNHRNENVNAMMTNFIELFHVDGSFDNMNFNDLVDKVKS